MKRKLLILLLISLFSSFAQATVEVGGISYNLSGTEATVTSGSSYTGDITIPSLVTYDGTTYQVTSIGERAFQNCNLKSIIIPTSVTSIGEYAFHYSSLPSVTIPNSVTEISNGTFSNCSNLTSVTIPNSVTTIGESAFSYCGLTSVAIPASVTKIGMAAFRDCENLKKVIVSDLAAWCSISFDYDANPLEAAHHLYSNESTEITDLVIPNGVINISDYAFSGCSGLESITIPNSVTDISSYAFSGCSGLTTVNIPGNVTSIGNFAFADCSGLTSITIPESVTVISNWVFSNCTSLTSFTIHNTVTSIRSGAFCNCRGLTSITIPSNVENIEVYSFSGCVSLASIKVDEKNTVYDSREDCNAIIHTENSAIIIGCKNTTIPNTVTRISERAFDYCYNLTSITFPSSVTSINARAFYGCYGLTSVRFEGNLPTMWKYFLSSFEEVGTPLSPVALIVPDEYYTIYENEFDDDGKFYGGYFTLYSSEPKVTLSPAGYATFYNEKVSRQLPAELSAMVVSGVTNKQLTYAAVAGAGGVVPAGTAVILCGPVTTNATTYTLSLTASDATYTGENLLHGSDVATETTGGKVFYKLTYGSEAGHENVFGWYWGAANGAAFSIGAHKAWLAVTRQQAGLDGGTGVKSFALPWNDCVGIEDIDGREQKASLSEAVYDLQGRRVARPTSGLYIVNGKKVAIK